MGCWRRKNPGRRRPVPLVRHDVSATRSASNRGSLRSCRPRSPLCRMDRANHQSNSQSTRRYPSRSPDIPTANVGTPLRGCRGRIRPWANDRGERRPPCPLRSVNFSRHAGASPSRPKASRCAHPGSSLGVGDAKAEGPLQRAGRSGASLRLSGPFGHDTTPGTMELASPPMIAHGWGLTARTVRQSRPRNVLQPLRWTPARQLCRAETIKKLTTRRFLQRQSYRGARTYAGGGDHQRGRCDQ